MDGFDLRDRTAICGVGLSAYGRRLGRSAIDLGADALRAAVDDAGLAPGDVDGLIVSFGTPSGADADTLAHTLGLQLRMYSQTWAHGRFTATCIQQAAMSVAAGLAEVVACMASVSFTGARRPRFGGSGDREGAREGGGGHGEDPVYGMTSPGAGAALVARAYFERYGASSRDLASVAVAFRRHASLNPTAMWREPITVEDHQASRLVCAPLHLLDYCQVNDGAACVIVTSAERARDLRKPAVLISGMQGLPAGRDEFIWSYPGFGIAQQESATHAAEPALVYRMGRPGALRSGRALHLRRVLDPGLDRARALGVLQAWRGRRLHAGRPDRAGRGAPDEHARRAALRRPHPGLEPPGRDRAAAARASAACDRSKGRKSCSGPTPTATR